MRDTARSVLWSTCLMAVCACVYAAEPGTPAASEPDPQILAGLGRLGVGEGYQIVVGDTCDVVEQTAAGLLQQFLAQASVNAAIVTESNAAPGKRFILGRDSNLEVIRSQGNAKQLDIRSVAAEDDGFHIKQIATDIVIAGANPRGVLYGEGAFEDFVREGRTEALDLKRVPEFRWRFESIPTFLVADHPAEYRDATEKNVAYLARLGVNGCIDGGGGSWELTRFVSSDVFPFQREPDPALQQKVASMSSLCKKYGIDYYIMLWEPLVPRSAAAIDAYPAEALGTVKRPWGGDEKGMDRTLCVCSPLVQDHYKGLITKFVRAYPDVKGFLFYNLDGDSWLCTPDLCPRCKAACTDSPGDTPHPWETQATFTDLLAQAAHAERPDFKFIHWISHFQGKAAEKLVQTSRYDGLAFGVRNGDHDVMIGDPVTPDGSEFGMLQRTCTEKSLPFLVTFSSNSHEVIPNGFQFPFTVAESMKKLRGWGVRNITSCGPMPYFNSVNVLVEREFQWNPEQNPEAVIAALSARQFGETAGASMYEAWQEITLGMDVWKDLLVHPFCGSQTHTSIGFSYFTMAGAIVPALASQYDNLYGILTNVEPKRAPDYRKGQLESMDRFRSMGTHFAKAEALAKRAIAEADANTPIGIHYYDGASIPSMKEYAELNYGPIAIANVYCHLRCNMFNAFQLLQGIKEDTAAGDATAAKEKEAIYHALIREDIDLRKQYIELLTQFSTMRPCIIRTSLSDESIAYQIAYMNTEIGKMETYLSEQK